MMNVFTRVPGLLIGCANGSEFIHHLELSSQKLQMKT